jgi:hypothetical protein
MSVPEISAAAAVASLSHDGGRPRRRPLPRASLSSVRIASSICSRSRRKSASILSMSKLYVLAFRVSPQDQGNHDRLCFLGSSGFLIVDRPDAIKRKFKAPFPETQGNSATGTKRKVLGLWLKIRNRRGRRRPGTPSPVKIERNAQGHQSQSHQRLTRRFLERIGKKKQRHQYEKYRH